MVISAVGMIDPSDSRYQSDKGLLQSDLRADSRSQLVEKALGLFVDKNSLAKNYEVLKDKLLSKSGSFVTAVVRESEPQSGKDGLMYVTTEGVVDVKAVQKSLNQMSRDERIEFIRGSGDPRVSVRITARDADQPDAPPRPSPEAENVLKERIKTFGFRTWSEGGARADDGTKGPDFSVEGEVQIKKLSVRLPASGLVVTKYGLNSWTIKCIDRETGEEIYYNTTMPTGMGSWASGPRALKAIDCPDRERTREFSCSTSMARRSEGHRDLRGRARFDGERHAHAIAGRITVGGQCRAGKATCVRTADGRNRPRRGSGCCRRAEAAQRPARPGMLLSRRRGGGQDFGAIRPALHRAFGALATGDQSARRVVQRTVGPPEGRDKESGDAEEADDLAFAGASTSGCLLRTRATCPTTSSHRHHWRPNLIAD